MIVPATNKVGTDLERDAQGRVLGTDWTKGRSGLVEYQTPGVSWEKSFTDPSTFADGSVRKGLTFYTPNAIPEKGYEERKLYVPNEFEASTARVGVGGGLNRTSVETETNKDADDPNYARAKRVPKWPFMYVQGLK